MTAHSPAPTRNRFPGPAYWKACIFAGIWLIFSEVVRYFVFVMPMTREAFPTVPGVAPMDLAVFSIWGVWMTLLTLAVVYMYWLHARQFDHSVTAILLAGTSGWVFFFVLFWLGNYNMGLADPAVIAIALPWAWVELIVTCWIARWVFTQAD